MTSSSPPSAGASHRGREFGRFLVAGAANTALSYALFLALERVMPYVVAYALAYVAGIVVSYLLNTALVFRVQRRWSSALRYPLVYVVQFLAGTGTVVLLVEAFGVAPWLAALAAIAVTVPITFVLSRAVLKSR